MNYDIPSRGQTVARYLRSMAMADGRRDAAAAFAASQGWRNGDAIVNVIRAGIPGVSDPDAIRPLALDLAEVVRPRTVIGRLPGVHKLPFLARTIGLSAGATATWVGEGIAAPTTGATFGSPTDLARKKIMALLVCPNEFLRNAHPAAERALINDLAGAVAQALDFAFLDSTNTGSASTPASVTNGGASGASLGSTVSQIDGDLGGMIDDLLDAGSTLESAVWCIHPRSAAFLSRLRGTGGSLAHPGISVAGGTLLGLPVLVTANIDVTADTDALTSIHLIDGDGVALCDDDEAEISFARQGSIEMADDATGDVLTPTGASKHQVSMFQTESTAVQMLRFVNWAERRAVVASTLTAVSY